MVPPAAASARWLENDAVCPVHTDGRSLLVVRFILANRSGRDLALDSVEPLLPRGGLRPQSTSTVSGDCDRWVPTDTGHGGIPSGGQRVVSMLFRLPPECPHRFAVRARVRVHAGSTSRTADLPVLSDLDGVAFESCPAEPLPQGSASGSS